MTVAVDIFEKPGSPLNVGALCLGTQHGTASTVNVDPNISYLTLDSTANAIAVQLPPAAQSQNRALIILLAVDPNSHNATITPNGSDTIGGASTKVLNAAGKSVMLSCSGTDWAVVLSN